MKRKISWSKIGGSTLAIMALLLIAGLAHAASGEGGSLSQAKLMDLLWRALNFAALVWLLVKFGAKPIANALKSRQASIKDRYDDLDARRSEADRSYRAFEAKLAGIDKEISEIIENAKAQAEVEKERIIADAARAADDIRRQAEMAIQHEMAEARLTLREEVANQAVLMAEELIKKSLREEDQVKLIEDYLEKVGTIQ